MNSEMFKSDALISSPQLIGTFVFIALLAALAYWIKTKAKPINSSKQKALRVTPLDKQRRLLTIQNDGKEYLILETDQGLVQLEATPLEKEQLGTKNIES